MSAKRAGIALAGLFALGCVTASLWLRRVNSRLEQRVVEQHRRSEALVRQRDEDRRVRQLAERAAAGEQAAADALHAELTRARGEVAALEARAEQKHAQARAQAAADATSLATNRDPVQGLVKLEDFNDTGQATPAAAFQTFVWAAMKGEESRLAGLIAFSGDARGAAEAVVAGLPDADREKYSSPEKLAALFFADALTSMPAAQIVDASLQDSQHAVLRVRGLTTKEQKVPLQLGANGWQILLDEGMAGKLESWSRRATQSSLQK